MVFLSNYVCTDELANVKDIKKHELFICEFTGLCFVHSKAICVSLMHSVRAFFRARFSVS